MGKYDSSLTRVQPIFDQLLGGRTGWLRDLLSLPERSDGPRAPLPADPGEFSPDRSPYEYPALPSREYLAWLVRNLDPQNRPAARYWNNLSASTRAYREELFAGNPETIALALSKLSSWPDLPETAWWLLEGRSKIDCAILTPNTVLFVEGKRTEVGPSTGTVWAKERNQVLRNLDCARSLAQHTGRPHYYVMLVVEEQVGDSGDERRAQNHRQVTDPEVVAQSLPHLTKAEREEALTHYLGMTTWQAIATRFALKLAQ